MKNALRSIKAALSTAAAYALAALLVLGAAAGTIALALVFPMLFAAALILSLDFLHVATVPLTFAHCLAVAFVLILVRKTFRPSPA
jgi:hypothetical protein